jgi:hypothetical protein
MLRRRGVFAAVAFALASLALAGCAIVDKYADRAVEYNLQAEKSQQQNLMLNIVRASLRRPMQFTTLSSITGTATASGSVTGGYTNQHQTPYISLFPLSVATPGNTQSAISRSVSGTGSGTATMSGGPTFTVPVLDTQEFYNGILTPVSPQIIDYYVQQGFPPELLFDLFVSNVELIVTDGGSCDRFTFRNDVRNDVRFGQFQALADYLLSSGFTTERVADNIAYGPKIKVLDASLSASETAKMVEAYSKASSAGLDIHSEKNTYQLQKKSSHYRFCFAVNVDQRPLWLGVTPDAYCGNAAMRLPSAQARVRSGPRAEHCPNVAGAQGSADGGTSQFHGVLLSQTFMDRIKRLQDDERAKSNGSLDGGFPIERFRNKHVTFKFQTRSVEGMLYYLGEITRQHLTPESGAASRLTQVKTGLRFGTIPQSECNVAENGGRQETKRDLIPLMRPHARAGGSYACENIFVLENDPAPDAFYKVAYDGTTYSIPSDPQRAGRSLQVLELVKQLMAINTSAKQLPQSSVISIVGGQ